MSAPETAATDRALALRLFRTYLAPRWRTLSVAIACAVLVATSTAMLAKLMETAVNDVLVEADPRALWIVPLQIVALAVLRASAQVGQSTVVNRLGHRMVGRIQVQLFGRLVRADLARLRSAHSGEYLSSVLYDSGLVREAATSGVVNYTQHALTVAGALAVMAFQDLWLTLAVLVAGPLVSLVMRRFARRTRKAARGAMSETSALSTAIMESLDGVKIVKVENRESYEEDRVAAVVERRQRHVIKGANARATAAPATETLSTMVLALVIAYAGWRAGAGGMNVGEFVGFLTALAVASQSLRQLANLQSVMSEGLTAAGRLFQALDIEPEISDAPAAGHLGSVRGEVRFEAVDFSYGADAPALSGVTLHASPGETIALVGPSGGGKSTILNLIPRFYDVTAGRVTVDGRDIREVTLSSLRSQIALVTQEPFLFDDTIRANIGYARPDATQEEIENAAHAAAAEDFIRRLPAGYDTVVGEAGARLSGGQRQRIAIARAFLKDAPILLLDEATSALDTESELKVQEALDRLMRGRTTILIAHRLSTVRGADRIYVLDRGRIVEEGAHAELSSSGGLYSRLARAQNLDVAPV